MGDAPFTKGNPELFEMDELEVFDIDYPWQFEVGEVLYNKFKTQKFEYSGGHLG
jgi:CMP-N-acetylneuraminic acid synthetase